MIRIGICKHAKNENYVHVGRFYVYDKLLYSVLVILILIPIIFFENPYDLFFSHDPSKLNEYVYYDRDLKKVNGTVKIKDDNGMVRYIGNVSNGICEGKGKLYNSRGTLIYEGPFESNEFSGDNGTMYNEDGSIRYVGSFQDNEYEGIGTLYRKDGSVEKEGQFKAGKLYGEGTIYKKDGNILYTGNFINDNYDGEGTLYDNWENRICYTGDFVKGKKEGQGTLLDSTGFSYYQGKMHEDYIDYTAFLYSSFEDIQACFNHHYDVFIYKEMTIFVYRKEQVAFISHNPIMLSYTKKQQIKDTQGNDVFISEVELDKGMDAKDIIIDQIMIMDSSLLYRTTDATTDKEVEKILDSYLYESKNHVNSYYPMFKETIHQLETNIKLSTVKEGSFVYVFKEAICSQINYQTYNMEEVNYTYVSKMDGYIKYVLLEQTSRKKK